ncbi:hypothetical protein N9E35_01625 [Candidatus Marinimicrobia bacterium]|nr:hypothetical protein [Candidatus Neomarinimicrobiota bacterium]
MKNSSAINGPEPLMTAEPVWIKTAKRVLEETQRPETPEKEDTKPLEIALTRQQLTVQKHQNILIGLLITAIEASGSHNPHFTGPNAIKASKLLNQSGLYD